MPSNANRRPVAVLGATGMVGQRLVSLLATHPWFELVEVAASSRSAAQSYAQAVSWQLPGGIPGGVAELTVRACTPDEVEAPVVFSGLDASVAGDVERRFAEAGRAVISNARNFRMEVDVPLVIPEVNLDHLALIDRQRDARRWPGFIVTNPNCSTIGLTLALAPIHRRFGIERLTVATLQAASGAGYPGVASMDLLGNVVPEIPGEEAKIETEPLKVLGELRGGHVQPAEMLISAQTHRVPVVDGHTLAISLATREPASVEQACEALAAFRGPSELAELPSAPEKPIEVLAGPGRPQPRLDAAAGAGMSVCVGRIRSCPVLGLRMVALSHNTVRGAAGGTLLIGEALAARGLLP